MYTCMMMIHQSSAHVLEPSWCLSSLFPNPAKWLAPRHLIVPLPTNNCRIFFTWRSTEEPQQWITDEQIKTIKIARGKFQDDLIQGLQILVESHKQTIETWKRDRNFRATRRSEYGMNGLWILSAPFPRKAIFTGLLIKWHKQLVGKCIHGFLLQRLYYDRLQPLLLIWH